MKPSIPHGIALAALLAGFVMAGSAADQPTPSQAAAPGTTGQAVQAQPTPAMPSLPRPSVIYVTDFHLGPSQIGTMTGFDEVRQLAAEGSRVPVIFITAHGEPPDREQTLALGCAYLRKPFSAQSLIEAIRQATHSNPPAAEVICDHPGQNQDSKTNRANTGE